MKSNSGFVRMFFTTLSVFIISIIVIEYLFGAAFVSYITDEIESNRKKEFISGWEKYFEVKRNNHFTKALGFSMWNVLGEAIRDGDNNKVRSIIKEDTSLEEEIDVFSIVDKNKNLLYGISNGINSEENKERFNETRNIELEKRLLDLANKKYNDYYKTDKEKAKDHINHDLEFDDFITWHSIEEYDNSINLLTSTLIFDDRGFIVSKGFYLFGENFEKYVKEAEKIISAKLEIRKEIPKEAYAFIKINNSHSKNNIYIIITPNIFISDIASNAINLLIIIQIILAIIAFAIIYPIFTKRYTKNLHQIIDKRTNKLTSSLSLLNSTLEATQEGILVLDREGNTIEYNSRFKEICDIPMGVISQLNNHKILDYIKTQFINDNELLEKFKYLSDNPEEESFDIVELKNKKIFELFSSPQIIQNKVVGRVYGFRDITKEKQNEEDIKNYIEDLQENKNLLEESAFEMNQLNFKLQESEKELEELNASKDKFFSILAHDLKSPFSGLMGISELMIEESDSFSKEEMKEYIVDVHNSSKKTFTLLENLLNWSQLQTGRMEFTPENIDLSEICKQVTSLLNNNVKVKNISLFNDIKNNVKVYADKNMVYTIIRNLISNAIKFTPKAGRIVLSEKESNSMITLTISDNGIGMAKDDVEKLFRIDKHHTTKGTDNEAGTGLGLILCAELVEKNGGEIWVTSQIGKGSEFNISLPKVSL